MIPAYPGSPFKAQDSMRPPSCTYCLKTKKKCTFVWAQAQLRGGANKASPGTDDSSEPAGAAQQFYGPVPGYDGALMSRGEADYGASLGPGMLAMKQQLSPQLDMFSSAPLDINAIPYASPASNSTDGGQWIAPAGTSLDVGQQAFWGSLPNLSSDETQSYGSHSEEGFLPGTDWLGRDPSFQNVDSELTFYQERNARRDSPRESWTNWTAPTSSLSLLTPQEHMMTISNNAMISENLLRIYHDVLEHNLSCWLAEETCPYGSTTLTLMRTSTHQGGMPNELGSTWSNKIYGRVKRLDRVAQRNRLLQLRPTEDQAASKALDLVIMAFASQWAQGSYRQWEQYKDGQGESPNHPGSDGTPPPEEFDRQIQRSLWGQAKAALENVSGLECFRVVCAELIFGLCQRPMDETSSWDSGDYGAYNSGSVMETLMDRLREATENEEPPIFMERGTRKIHALKCKFDLWEAGWLDRNRGRTGGGADAEIKEGKRTVQLLYWLSVMFDTISSSTNERPVVVADEECQHDAAWDMQKLGDAIDSYGQATETLPQKWQVNLFIQDDLEKPSKIPSWPCSYDDAAATVTKSAPVKVLLFRHVSYLQSAIRRGRRGKVIEDNINASMMIYKYWNVTYGPFHRSLIRDYDAVPPRVQSWFVCIASHWHLAVLLLAESISFVDKKQLGIEDVRRKRTNANFCRQMAKSSAMEISDIAAVAAPKHGSKPSNNASQWSLPPGTQDPSFHSVTHEGAILTEPWTILIIRAFTKAAAIHLERAEELWHSRSSDPSGGRGEIQGLLDRCEHCTRALWLLGKKSDMARKAAEILTRAHSELAGQIAMGSVMVPVESWEGILNWIST
ncbi:unnamed protein product [Clonostachys solani]|uniref:Regulatory protein alcR n=1 Tax=Clonostachys solani TaxID=160281 RepID=A0A9N9YXW5_9HYPO|nr:unnamed protein product [Clonostachys solani]